MLGMGSGQPNRRESLRIAFRKAGEEAKGAALASDAFFPFGEEQHDLFPSHPVKLFSSGCFGE